MKEIYHIANSVPRRGAQSFRVHERVSTARAGRADGTGGVSFDYECGMPSGPSDVLADNYRQMQVGSAAFAHFDEAPKTFTYSYLPGSNLLRQLTMPNGMSLQQAFEEKRNLLSTMSYMRGASLLTSLFAQLLPDLEYPGPMGNWTQTYTWSEKIPCCNDND